MAMQVKELGHVVLYVHNVERSAAFYRDVLGFRQVVPSPEGGYGRMGAAAFSSGRTHHELLLIEVGEDAKEIPGGRRVGMYHFGLKVGDSDDELRAAIQQLRNKGANVVGASDHGATHSVYLLDPDGNEVEVYIDVPGVDWVSNPALAMVPAQPLRL